MNIFSKILIFIVQTEAHKIRNEDDLECSSQLEQNITKFGRPCAVWKDLDHNFCRDLEESRESSWCYLADYDKKVDGNKNWQYCRNEMVEKFRTQGF